MSVFRVVSQGISGLRNVPAKWAVNLRAGFPSVCRLQDQKAAHNMTPFKMFRLMLPVAPPSSTLHLFCCEVETQLLPRSQAQPQLVFAHFLAEKAFGSHWTLTGKGWEPLSHRRGSGCQPGWTPLSFNDEAVIYKWSLWCWISVIILLKLFLWQLEVWEFL